MTHDELKALLPLAALERLEPDEIVSLREHLAGCVECDAELREFEHAIAMLALAVDAPITEDRVTRKLEARLAAPAASLAGVVTPTATAAAKAATPSIVVAAAPPSPATPASEKEPVRAKEPVRPVEPTPRERPRRWFPRLAFAAAILLGLYGAAVTSRMMDLKRAYDDRGDKLAYLQSRFTTLEHQAQQAEQKLEALSKVLSERIRLEQVLDAPDLQVTRLAPLPPVVGAHALVVLSKTSGDAVLRATGLEAPPPGKIYELWWITKQKGPVQAATFTVESGKEVTEKVTPPPTGERVMASAITLEPAGGVPKPTGVMYLKGSPEHE